MNKRELIKSAINHKPTAYTPWQMDMTGEFAKKVCEKYACKNADEFVGNHMIRAKYKQNTQISETLESDIFGVTWEKSLKDGDVGIVVGFPIQETNLNYYEFPQIRTDFAKKQAESLLAFKDNRFTMFSITMGFFERAWSLRGMENILMDMVTEEKFCQELFGRIEQHHLELLDVVLDYDFDALYFGDDWGQQKGLIMGPPLWRKYIKPSMKRIFEKAKSKGKKVVLHSCGDLRDIMPEVIEIGVDVYNTIQPEIYDIKQLKQEYGNDLSFYGGISTQQLLPYASAREVYDVTSRVRDILGEKGGYILSPTHAITADTPVENLWAMIKVAKGKQFHEEII